MRPFIKLVLLHALFIGFCACSSAPEKIDLRKGISSEDAEISVSGIDVQRMSFTIQPHKKMEIIIPAGTRLASSSSGTQNMMTARTIRIFCTGSPDTPYIKTDVEVYCVNRFLDAPTSASQFTIVTDYTTGSDSLQLLAECLETKGADHDTRQLAIWLRSDNLMDLSKEEATKKLEDYYRHTIEEEIENSKDELIAKFRNDQPEYADYPDEEVLEAIRLMNPVIAKEEAGNELKDYIEKAGPLLKDCGIDISGKLLFQ